MDSGGGEKLGSAKRVWEVTCECIALLLDVPPARCGAEHDGGSLEGRA